MRSPVIVIARSCARSPAARRATLIAPRAVTLTKRRPGSMAAWPMPAKRPLRPKRRNCGLFIAGRLG